MKICIVKLSAMGDIIHAMVALEFIKKAYPKATIDWIVERSFQAVLEYNPHIDTILPLELKKIKQNKLEIINQLQLVKTYAKNDYDIIIDAQGLLKSALVAKLLKSKKSVVYGFSKSSIREKIATWFYDSTIDIGYEQNTIDRNVAILTKPLNLDIKSSDILNKQVFLYFPSEENSLAKPYNLFVIGSTWESRNYPKEKFVEIAESLKKETYIVWGSEEEKQKANWMQKQSKYLKVLPKGNLNDLKRVIAGSSLLIGNDTGPTHMAWGLNIPSITIFGPTPTNRVYTTKINKVVKSNSIVNHYKLDKNDFSIYEIDPKKIISIAKELL